MVIQPLLAVLISLVLAYVLSEFLRLFGLPRVVGQISAGIILSIATLYYNPLFAQASLDTLSFLADLGIILLFYYVGLETNFRAFTKNIRKSILISVFNTSIPFTIGFLVMKYLFGFDVLTSIIIGVSLSVSAQVVAVDILDEIKKLKTRVGNLIVSIGAVNDTIELVLVTVLLSVFHFSVSHSTLLQLLRDVSIFLLLIITAKKYIIPYTLKFFDREKSSTARFTGSTIIVLLIATLSHVLGLGLLIGSMIAGIIVRQTIFKYDDIPDWEEHDIARSTHIIAFGFLIPLFFVWVGLNTQINLIGGNIGLIAVFILIAMLGIVGSTTLATLLTKGTLKEGLTLGWGLNQKGDVELVISTIALKAGVITPQIFTSIVMMSLFINIVSPIVFKFIILRRNKG